MRNFTIEILNYRCFAGPTPAKWAFLGDGLTSFVGPNNAGKSTFLRLIYEFRGFFSNIATQGTLITWTIAGNIGIGLTDIEDVAELPSVGTDGPVIVDFCIDGVKTQELCRLRLIMDRESRAWNMEMWHSWPPQKVAGLQRTDPPQMAVESGRSQLQARPFCDWVNLLAQKTMYIPAFRNLINQGGGTYYDIVVATEFIKLWDNWKNGGEVKNRRAILAVEDDIQSIFGFKEFEVNATPGKETFNIIVDGRTERVRELGAGISQFIMVLGNVAIKRPELLLIDEPELNLHPALQQRFLTALSKYAKHVIFASHSMGLARTAEHVYSITRNESDTSSEIKPLPATRSYAELLGEMGFSAYREVGFEQVMCVEGITDVKTIQEFLRRLNLDNKVVVIPLGGGSFITAGREQELAELKRISPQVAVLIDSERKNATDALGADRAAFVESCEKLGFNVHVTDRRATEHYFPETAVQRALGTNYHALEPYEDFDVCPHKWAKSDNWRIAEKMTLPELMATDMGVWLADLASTDAGAEH